MGGSRWPLINDPINLVALCLLCHRWVESNRTQATSEHWLLGSEWLRTTDASLIPLPLGWHGVRRRDAKPDVRQQQTHLRRVEPISHDQDAHGTSDLPFQ